MDFTRYSAADFLLDESFQAYVADADSEAGRRWRAWLREHPEKAAEVAQAYALGQGLRLARPCPVPAGLKQQELRRLRPALRAPAPRLGIQRRAWLALSALTLLVLVGLLSWGLWPRPLAPAGLRTRYVTAQGQHRTIVLPDSSVVVLNGHSTLTTAAHWTPTTAREVWLTGEGFFRVKHRAAATMTDVAAAPANVRFVVHAGELNVSVLGTQFDVNSRPGRTQVVLSAGRVAVARQARLTRENLLLEPGDLVETLAARPGLARRRVPPALYSAWMRGQFEFHQTPVRYILQLLRDAYGLQVVVRDSAMLRQTITGTLPAANPEVIIPALAKSLDLRVTRTGNTVHFQQAGP